MTKEDIVIKFFWTSERLLTKVNQLLASERCKEEMIRLGKTWGFSNFVISVTIFIEWL